MYRNRSIVQMITNYRVSSLPLTELSQDPHSGVTKRGERTAPGDITRGGVTAK